MLLLLVQLACTDGSGSVDIHLDTGASDGGGTTADGGGSGDGGGTGDTPPPCPVGAEHEQTGSLQDPAITEASGLVASPTAPGILWLHNDSGDEARLFAVAATGETVATVTLPDVTAGDWEDMALGAGVDGSPWLYIGDIGDNGLTDGSIRVWMLPEPPLQDGTASAAALEASYPDGPHDAEALLVDPATGLLYVITKELGGVSQVYSLDPTAAVPALSHVASVDLNGTAEGILTLVTAADTTPDGGCVLVRTYTHLLGYTRPAGAPLEAAFDSPPVVLEVAIELQGETVASHPGGYWTVSEGEGAALNHYALPPPP